MSTILMLNFVVIVIFSKENGRGNSGEMQPFGDISYFLNYAIRQTQQNKALKCTIATFKGHLISAKKKKKRRTETLAFPCPREF